MGFADDLRHFEKSLEGEATGVVRDSFVMMYDAMQKPLQEPGGLVPVDTGLLRGSLVITINGVPVTLGDYNHRMAAPLIKLGDRIGSYRHDVHYAVKQEYGFMLDNGHWHHGRFYTTIAARGWSSRWVPQVIQARGGGSAFGQMPAPYGMVIDEDDVF